MKRKLYSVRDYKMNEFNAPCIFANDAMATRSFGDLITRDKDSMLAIHPEDFALYAVGEFDTDSGVITSFPVPELVCQAVDFIKPLNA